MTKLYSNIIVLNVVRKMMEPPFAKHNSEIVTVPYPVSYGRAE